MRKPVLTIFYQFNPWHTTIGGIQTIIINFIKYAPQDFDVRLVGTGVDPTQPLGKWQETELAGRQLFFLPLILVENDDVRGLIPTTLRYTGALMKRNFASDFMHFHRIEPTLATFNWQGDKTLVIHNDIEEQMSGTGNKGSILWRYLPSIYFWLERKLVGQFSQILSCNSNSCKLYSKSYPEIAERIMFYTNTVDPEIFYPFSAEWRATARHAFAKARNLPDDTRFLLFAGRLHPQKDPVLLVQTMAALEDANVHLLMAGDGELLPTVKAEIERLGLSKQVSLLGILGGEQLAEVYRICHIFVLSSVYEGLPLTVLEALACGVPVVTTNCGETPNLLTPESGIVVNERTPNAIATALRQILDAPDAYPSEACIRVAQNSRADEVIAKIYDQMLERWIPE
jgi:glycosyltransferase involved in cell wall biosynthesis